MADTNYVSKLFHKRRMNMKKNLSDWLVRMGMEMLFTCCLLSFAALGVYAACSGNDYCGITTASSTACSSAKVQMYQGTLACYPDMAPGGAVNCFKKDSSQEECNTCSCKSTTHPDEPEAGEQCSCQ
jgi:hypothetical protein